MHWASVMTAFVLALISAHLVFHSQWSPTEAFVMVGSCAIVLILALFGVLLAVAAPEHRRALIDDVWRTLRQDARELLAWITGRSRR